MSIDTDAGLQRGQSPADLGLSDMQVLGDASERRVPRHGQEEAEVIPVEHRRQAGKSLPSIETAKVTGLIYATLHGATDLKLGGRARERRVWAASRRLWICCLTCLRTPTGWRRSDKPSYNTGSRVRLPAWTPPACGVHQHVHLSLASKPPVAGSMAKCSFGSPATGTPT